MTSTLHHCEHGPHGRDGFRHEALFYAGHAEFLERTAAFVEDGLRAGEPVMVALPAVRLELLRAALGEGAGSVTFAAMEDIGRNPARIIPAWQDFVDLHRASGRPFRGIGEPIWSTRSAEELVECQLHEILLNVAFTGGPAWRLLCPYDAESLSADVLDEARRSHPYLHDAEGEVSSTTFADRSGPEVFAGTLPDPPPGTPELAFDAGSLPLVRRSVSGWAAAALPPALARDFVLAVHEVATNSVRHGGGLGTVRCWSDGDGFVCEVRDMGRLQRDLVGRVIPPADVEAGRGLWLANQLCDLVQLRSTSGGTVVRLRISPN